MVTTCQLHLKFYLLNIQYNEVEYIGRVSYLIDAAVLQNCLKIKYFVFLFCLPNSHRGLLQMGKDKSNAVFWRFYITRKGKRVSFAIPKSGSKVPVMESVLLASIGGGDVTGPAVALLCKTGIVDVVGARILLWKTGMGVIVIAVGNTCITTLSWKIRVVGWEQVVAAVWKSTALAILSRRVCRKITPLSEKVPTAIIIVIVVIVIIVIAAVDIVNVIVIVGVTVIPAREMIPHIGLTIVRAVVAAATRAVVDVVVCMN